MTETKTAYRDTTWGKRAAKSLPADHRSASGLIRTALASARCADESGQPNRLTHQRRAERMLSRAIASLRAEMEADR